MDLATQKVSDAYTNYDDQNQPAYLLSIEVANFFAKGRLGMQFNCFPQQDLLLHFASLVKVDNKLGS